MVRESIKKDISLIKKQLEDEIMITRDKMNYTKAPRLVQTLKQKLMSLMKEHEKLADKLNVETERSQSYQLTKENTSIRVDILNPPISHIAEQRIIQNGHISDSRGLDVEFHDIKKVLFLQNVTNSRIKCSAMQIRLTGCSDIILECFTLSGVFIEDCVGISIKEFISNVEIKNEYRNVKDFTDPINSKNFSFI